MIYLPFACFNPKLKAHFSGKNPKVKIAKVPQGDIYKSLLERYLIAAPTMMMRKQIVDDLGGYDETLAYEDFDFWIRSSRRYHYAYLPQVLTAIRLTPKSLSSLKYGVEDRLLHSTFQVCQKALDMNQNEVEGQALKKRIQYEMRQALFHNNFEETISFYGLLKKMDADAQFYGFLYWLAKHKISVSVFWKIYCYLKR